MGALNRLNFMFCPCLATTYPRIDAFSDERCCVLDRMKIIHGLKNALAYCYLIRAAKNKSKMINDSPDMINYIRGNEKVQ